MLIRSASFPDIENKFRTCWCRFSVNEEMESEDYSLETTVPTDLSLSPDEISEFGHGDKKKRISKQLLERKQLLHDYQVLKIEVSQKSLLIDNMKAEHMQRVEELEEKLSDALHQKQILQARLESQLHIQQEEARRRTEQIQRELDLILKRQQQLEGTNERLQEKAVDVRRSLKDLELTEHQYLDLKSQEEETMALKDFVAIKMFEAVKPWKTENSGIKSRCKGLSDELHETQTTLDRCQEDLEKFQRKHAEVDVKYQRMHLTLAETTNQVKQGDYKVDNFDRINKERNELEAEVTDLKKQLAYVEAGHETAGKDRDDLRSELNNAKQYIALLKQDKDFFAKQSSDLQNKLLYTEEKIITLNDQLDRTKEAREELYDKYVASRDQYKTEYEGKLRDELEQIRTRTNVEIDRLKTSTKEMYERENRNLREARDMALSEKDRASASEKEALGKYEKLMQEFRHMQISHDTKMSELINEVKLKAFEAERIQMVHEETVRNLKDCQMEDEKLTKKLEVLTKEYYGLQTSLEKQNAELQTSLNEKSAKLETYEKLEQELDDVVMQAAEVENEDEAERVLFSYGYGANVPTTARRRLKQSCHLARRVLQLERENTTLRKDVQKSELRCKDMGDELKTANVVLDQSQQPYHYLVESIRSRDGQIKAQKEHIITLEEDYRRIEAQHKDLMKLKNQMALDLERLLNQREEMSMMKQVVQNINLRKKGSHIQPSSARSGPPRSPKPKSSTSTKKTKTAVHQPFPTYDAPERDTNVHKPAPTEFTNRDAPDWYTKLQMKKAAARGSDRKLTS